MNLKGAKEYMRNTRSLIKYYKEERKKISEKIHRFEEQIRNTKGAIFRGEIQ